MTREELAALTDQELDERVALDLMGWRQIPETERDAWEKLHPGPLWYHEEEGYSLPAYSQSLSDAWQVVQRITRIPQSMAEATVAPNARFGYIFEWLATAPGVKTLWALSEQEAARWICTEALLAWHSGPLFLESEQADDR